MVGGVTLLLFYLEQWLTERASRPFIPPHHPPPTSPTPLRSPQLLSLSLSVSHSLCFGQPPQGSSPAPSQEAVQAPDLRGGAAPRRGGGLLLLELLHLLLLRVGLAAAAAASWPSGCCCRELDEPLLRAATSSARVRGAWQLCARQRRGERRRPPELQLARAGSTPGIWATAVPSSPRRRSPSVHLPSAPAAVRGVPAFPRRGAVGGDLTGAREAGGAARRAAGGSCPSPTPPVAPVLPPLFPCSFVFGNRISRRIN